MQMWMERVLDDEEKGTFDGSIDTGKFKLETD